MRAVGGLSRKFHAHAEAPEEFAEGREDVELGFLKEGGEVRRVEVMAGAKTSFLVAM